MCVSLSCIIREIRVFLQLEIPILQPRVAPIQLSPTIKGVSGELATKVTFTKARSTNSHHGESLTAKVLEES